MFDHKIVRYSKKYIMPVFFFIHIMYKCICHKYDNLLKKMVVPYNIIDFFRNDCFVYNFIILMYRKNILKIKQFIFFFKKLMNYLTDKY